jgi:hypothetical protein
MRFGLHAVRLTNRAIERADGFVGLARFAIDPPFDGGCLRITRANSTRRLDFRQSAVGVIYVSQYACQADMSSGQCRLQL